MQFEPRDDSFVIKNNVWLLRAVGAFFVAVGGVVLWRAAVASELDVVVIFFWAFGVVAVVLGGLAALASTVNEVVVDAKNQQLLAHWASPLRRSVEQIPASAVASISIEEDASEGATTYSIYVTLKNGKWLYLTSGLSEKPVLLHREIEQALGRQ